MGLDSTDRLPFGISLKEAYKKIRTWYKSNKSQLKSLNAMNTILHLWT